jgi:tRNA dimethylallyltransferase
VASAFFIVGPTASGKSELAADVAVRVGAEIVNADAFQIYEGFDLLSAKPDAGTLRKVPHHLIGVVPISHEMSAARYRELALPVISEIAARDKLPLVVGGSGLYTKALTHGLAQTPPVDPRLREDLNALTTDELSARLAELDPVAAAQVDTKNQRRLVRAIEICLLSGRPASAQRTQWKERTHTCADGKPAGSTSESRGTFVFRDRDDLYQRINKRVEAMMSEGAIEEVRTAGKIDSTAAQMIGIREIQQLIADDISLAECTAKIQQYTRRYAKRQLTWFRQQTNFESLNLSLLSHNEAVDWVTQRAVARAHGE